MNKLFKLNKFSWMLSALSAVLILGFSACGDDEPVIVLADASASFTSSVSGLTVDFTNTSTDALSFTWDFGDGATSTDAAPSHTYSAGGTYSVVLKAVGPSGLESTSTSDVTVEDEVIADVVNIDFEAGELTWGIFGGNGCDDCGMALARVDNPDATGINTTGFVMKIDQEAGVNGWAGFYTDLETKIDFTNKKVFKVKVWSSKVGTVVKLKLEDKSDGANNKEIDYVTTVADQWEEATFTFAAADSNKWDRLVLFLDFLGDAKPAASTNYFDEILL